MAKKILRNIIIILILIVLTMANFLYVGTNLISYAQDGNNTNNSNIEFDAYFRAGEGITDTINTSPNNAEAILLIAINVRNEGYINGKINLKDANFEFISSNSEYVNKIENNEIILNQINAEEYAEIEVKVRFNKLESRNTEMFCKSSEITFEGIYINHEQKDISVSGNKTVTLNFVSNAIGEDVTSEVSIITNKVLVVNEEEKRVIQLSVKSGIRDNNYPIQEISVDTSAPELEGIRPEIYKRSKGNETVLTYIYPKEVEINDSRILTKTNLLLYDNTKISSPEQETILQQNEECDGTINAKIVQHEESISKGKLLSGIDREIKQTTEINVNLIGITQNAIITEKQVEYETEDGRKDANTYYVQSVINKTDILNILGEDGRFAILDENENVIAIITKDTETDENGNIVINYEPNQIKTAKFMSSEPKQLGTIKIETTKVIKASDKNLVNKAMQICSMLEQKEKTEESKIKLEDAKSEAKININKKDLSTLGANKVEIRSEFQTSNETQLLYKNPKIKVILPEQVEEVNVNSINTIYADQFEITKAEMREIEDGKKEISIALQGEQTNYNNVENQEMEIIMEGDISFKEEIPSQETSIKMLYKNENDEDQTYETEEKINIIAQNRTAENEETSNEQESNSTEETVEKVDTLGDLKIKAISAGKELNDGEEINEGQTVKMLVTLTNNTGRTLTNVKLKAKQENGIFYTRKEGKRQDTSTPDGTLVDSTKIIEDETLTEKEIIAEQIEAGESFIYEYEFSVKEKPDEYTVGTATIEADGIEAKTINLLSNKIKDADLKLNIFYAKDEERKVCSGEILMTKLLVKNTADKKLENIMVEIPLTEDIEVDTLGMINNDNAKYLGTENGIAKFVVYSLEKQETEEIVAPILVKEYTEDSKQINVSFVAKVNEREYVSNELSKNTTLEHAVLTIEQKGNVNEGTVRNGQSLIYTATIKNERDRIERLTIGDEVPKAAVIKRAYVVFGDTITEIENIKDNIINEETTIPAKGTIKFVAETVINSNLAENSQLENKVTIEAEKLFKISNSVSYKIEGVVDPVGPGGEEQKKNTISGTLWIDTNENGQRDIGEEVVKNKEIKLLDATTGEQVIENKTNNEGKYSFANLTEGSYIVMVEYDSTRYSLAEYKKSGISEDVNCDAISKNVNGKTVAMTNIIRIKESSVNNIDIGFKNNKLFDLSLEKTVKEITVQNSQGTRVVSYDNTSLAKVEIDRKFVKGTNVIVKYEIKVTNEGEIAGYANDIVDKIPSGFKFDSELNKTWYDDGKNQVHNKSLANEKINPGESKTVSIVLRKTMTENNIGTSVNTAEIAESTNDLLIQDRDSIAGNNAKEEDDQSTAEVIISIKTGEILIMSIVIGITCIILTIVALIIMKRRRENE